MNILTLIEDRMGNNKDLHREHGLSMYFEVDGKRILFDTGDSGKFIDNARNLKVDLNDLDYVFISHNHYDHSGGLKRLVDETNPDFKLYVGNRFFDEKYILKDDGEYENLGNQFDEVFLNEKGITISYVKEDVSNITENLLVFTNFIRNEEFENTNKSMYIKKDGAYEKDPFLEEIALGIQTDKGLIVIVGCSHPGIVNMLDTIIQRTGMDIYALIGGTHLLEENEPKINKIIEYIRNEDIKILAACHCTGEKALAMMEGQLPDRFHKNNTGNSLEV